MCGRRAPEESKASAGTATEETAATTPDSTSPDADESKTEAGKEEDGGVPVTSGPKSDDTDGFVHLDAMMAGMGMCCLQVTFQARDLDESLRLYDQLAVLGPIMVCVMRAPVSTLPCSLSCLCGE